MHHQTKTLEFPKPVELQYKKAVKYEWLSFFYMISAMLFSFLAMSNSQTMKTVWLEDFMGIIPPLSFLIPSKIVKKKANLNFPYGFHRVISIGFLSGSLALFVLGLYLLIDGTLVLISQVKPNIGYITLFNHSIWFGYIMIAVLLWSSLPSILLGYIKLPLSKKLYDKALYADSNMNKASWMSGFASIAGIIGIGLGFWWADALAGILISIDIIYDGFSNVKQAILDLMDEVPTKIGESKKTEPLIGELKKLILEEDWIVIVDMRFRDEGHVLFGDIFIQPSSDTISIKKNRCLVQ